MELIFFIKSTTVDIDNYTIKNIPSSSGRLDVISRCILSALINDDVLEKNVQIYVFLEKYGTFIFRSNLFNNESFPKNEILLTDLFVDFIKKTKKQENYFNTQLDSIIHSNLDIFHAIKNFVKKKYKIYVLSENGIDFKKVFEELSSKDKLLFILGDQSGDLLKNEELKKLNLTNLSLSSRSYLASSTIKIVKMLIDTLL